MSKITNKFLVAAALSLCCVGSALANLITFDVQWSGSSFGNNASATGFITFDDAVLPEVGVQNVLGLPNAAIIDLGITISGSIGGNGSFGISDFGSFFFWTPSPLDLSTELIGQNLTNGCTFGTSQGPCGNGLGGDFNLFGSTAGAPIGTYFFQLTTAGGDNMLVTSMTPSIPEPASLALLGIGLFGLGVMRRKQRA